MSGAGRKRWWRAAAVAAVGGAAVFGGWFGFARNAAAEPKQPAPLLPVADDTMTWTRPAAAPQGPGEPAAVVQTAAAFPVPAIAAPAAVPVLPVPVLPDADPAAPPAIPPLPPGDLPALPPAPKAPEVKPLLPPKVELPAAPALPSPPAMPADAPAPIPVPPVGGANPVVPPLPQVDPAKPPVVPAPPMPAPVLPLPAAITPPPPPAKSPEPAVPATPIKPDSGLRGGNTGNTVKTGNPGEVPALPAVPPAPPAIPVPDPVKPAVPVVPVPDPVKPAGPIVPTAPAVGAPGPVPGTTVDRPKPKETPLSDSEKFVFPIPAAPNTPATTPGDAPVFTLHKSAAAAVLGGALLATPAPAVAAPPLPVAFPVPVRAADDKADAAELRKQLEDSNRKLATIQEQLRVLTELLNGRKDEKGFPLPSDPGIVYELKQLKDRLAQLEKDLGTLKTQTALRPATTPGPVTNPIVDPRAGKATVRVVNEYPVQISIVVNGTSHRIAPSKSLDVEVAAGEFSYQLLEAGGAVTKSVIKEKETVTLRIK